MRLDGAHRPRRRQAGFIERHHRVQPAALRDASTPPAAEPGRRPRLGVGQRRARRLPDRPADARARDRPVHLRRRRDHPHRHRPGPARAGRPPRPVGGDGGRPGAGPRRGRGADPLGHAAQQLLPHRHRRHHHRRPGHRRRRPAHARSTRRPTATSAVFDDPFRFDITPPPQPPRRVRVRHPLLPRRLAGPVRAAACSSAG